MKVVKYDEVTNTYTNPFEVDIPSLLSDDWEYQAECPSCHKRAKWGEMINCGNYYTVGGLWLIPVCPDCAKKILG